MEHRAWMHWIATARQIPWPTPTSQLRTARGEEKEKVMNPKAYGMVDGHLVQWDVRRITWCTVCGARERAGSHGLCARCDADARLLVESVFGTPAQLA